MDRPAIDIIVEGLKADNYKIEEVCYEDDNITIRYQISIIHIYINTDNSFIGIVCNGLEDISDEDRLSVYETFNKLNNKLFVTKYMINDDTVLAAYEFFYDDFTEEALLSTIRIGLDAVITAKAAYQKIRAGY